jgi:hypothetical protein
MREGSKQCGIASAADREKSNADPPPDCLSGNSDHCGLVELLKCRRRQIARGLYNQPDQPDREHGPVAGSAIRRVLIEPIPLRNDRARPGRLLSGFGCRPLSNRRAPTAAPGSPIDSPPTAAAWRSRRHIHRRRSRGHSRSRHRKARQRDRPPDRCRGPSPNRPNHHASGRRRRANGRPTGHRPYLATLLSLQRS